jgi:pilus assembly protein FimV
VNNHFEPLDNGEVLSISESALIYIGHTTFRVGEFSEAVRSQLEHNTEGWNEGKNSWFTDTGVDCEVLRFTSGGWQKGKVRLRLEFSPDDGSSSSATQGTATQPVSGGMGMPAPMSIADTLSNPTSAQLTEDTEDSFNLVEAALPIAAVVGTAAVVGGIALGQGDASPAEDSLLDEDFDLDTATPEAELAGLDDEDFDLDSPQDDFASPEASALEDGDGDMDFAGDEFGDQPEASLLDENLDSEFADADLSSLGSEDFSLESSEETNEVDLSALEDTDFSLEDTLEDQAITSLEDAEFDLGTAEADLSDLAEDNFNLDTMGEEAANSETPDISLENSLTEFTSLEEDEDFGLESSMGLGDLENADLSLEEDFGLESSTEMELGDLENAGLDDFGDEEFALETPTSEPEMGGLDDFAASSNDEFASSENDDFGLDDLGTDFSGLENADFGSGESEVSSSFEEMEISGLEDEFGLDTPEFSATPEEPEGFGLDDLLGDDSGSDDLEFLSISDQEKQQFEQAAAEVSQAFDEDFGLELESSNGLDGLDFDFAGDDAMDAIDQQLSAALDDDLDLLGDAEGLTENLFADQDDALFKDVWGDINKTQVK